MSISISGYTTVRNAKQMDYPFEATIYSLLSFCDEVVVADSSDGTDDTLEVLQELMDKHDKIKVYHVEVPWHAPNHGIYDGLMKAYARSQCTGQYLFQIDCDEVAEDNVRGKIEEVIKKMGDYPLVALPVVEYWGSKEKIRIDVNPWKWRLSKNIPGITHGIPKHLRFEKNGLLFAKYGTDGCDYIWENDGTYVPCLNFVDSNIELLRRRAIKDLSAAEKYKIWFKNIIKQLPTVYHFSWWNIETKIKKYKYFWNDSWLSLYGEKETKPDWNPFFDKPFKFVTEEEIKEKAKQLSTETGGHIFHTPWNGEKINSITFEHSLPSFIEAWAYAH